MGNRKFGFIALALLASAVCATAGTEMLEPNYAPQPQPQTYYAPPPVRPVYIPPPFVSVVVGPRYRYYPRPYAVYRSHRFYPHRAYFYRR